MACRSSSRGIGTTMRAGHAGRTNLLPSSFSMIATATAAADGQVDIFVGLLAKLTHDGHRALAQADTTAAVGEASSLVVCAPGGTVRLLLTSRPHGVPAAPRCTVLFGTPRRRASSLTRWVGGGPSSRTCQSRGDRSHLSVPVSPQWVLNFQAYPPPLCMCHQGNDVREPARGACSIVRP